MYGQRKTNLGKLLPGSLEGCRKANRVDRKLNSAKKRNT